MVGELLDGTQATPAIVRETVRVDLERHAQARLRLRQADPLVDDLLARAAASKRGAQVWQRGATSLSYDLGANGPMLVLARGFTTKAIWLRSERGRYVIAAEDRDELAGHLLGR